MGYAEGGPTILGLHSLLGPYMACPSPEHLWRVRPARAMASALLSLDSILYSFSYGLHRPSWPSATMPHPMRMRTSLGPRSSGLSAGCGKETCAGLTISGPSPSATGFEAALGGGLQSWRSTCS